MASIRPSLQIPFACLTTVCLLATTTPAPAHSTTILSADDSAALTRSAAASASVAPTTYREFFSDSSTTASTAQDTERTEVRASNSGNSITHFSNNESFSVSLPGSSSNVTRSSDSTVATLGDDARSDNFALAITTPAEGEATVHSILLTESAPQTFSYTFHNITRISSDGHGGSKVASAAKWLGSKAGWVVGKTWSGVKVMAPKGLKAGKFLAKKVGPGAVVLCAAGAGWAWYRSDAHGWVRVGDAVSGCLF